jgi:hypothetical protein
LPKVASLIDQTNRQVLVEGVKISGRVLDGLGRPIPRAVVVDSTRGFTFLTYLRRAFTDPDGRFHIHLPPNGNATLTASAHGFAPNTLTVKADLGIPAVEYRLDSGRMLRARIVDPDGWPVAGANIIIPNTGTHKGIFFRRWSDRDGRFEWADAPAEQVEFSIAAYGYVHRNSVALVASDQEALVVLEREIDVRLHVIDTTTGASIGQFNVEIGIANPDANQFRWQPAPSSGLKGDYRAAVGTNRRPYRFRVSADGYTTTETRTFENKERSPRDIVRLTKEKP